MKLFFVVLLAIPQLLLGQTRTIHGVVSDNRSGQPLPFVNVIVKHTYRGTTTDLDGRFAIELDANQSLEFRYVGYQTLLLAPGSIHDALTVRLMEQPTQLKEVVVRAGENPALKIVRRAIENKPRNDPQQYDTYSYNSYNKLIGSLAAVDMSQAPVKDSVAVKRFMEENHLFVSESYTFKQFSKPNLNKETVLGNRFSGLKDPFFAFLATDFQPFGFYEETIRLLDKFYLNPISNGGLKRYDYAIMDTIIHETDSVYILGFEPFEGKAFESLKGQVYINTDGYAIEHVLAQPADSQLMIMPSIQQQYKKIGGYWFPIVLNSELRFSTYVINGAKPYYASRSLLSNVTINQPIPPKTFGLLNVEFDRAANKQDETFWDVSRSDSLSRREKNTYTMYDTLQRQVQIMTGVMKVLEGLFVGKFKAGKFYIPIEHLIRINRYEGVRLGIGLQTGEQLSRVVSLDGYVGYGFSDRALKYGAGFQINVASKKDLFIRASYNQDIAEPGLSNFIKSPVPDGSQWLRNWLTSRMDSVEQVKVEVNWRPLRFTQLQLYVQRQQRDPAYAYRFQPTDALIAQHKFDVAEAGVRIRYAPKETFIQLGPHKVVAFQTYPQLQINFSAAQDVLDGDNEFAKAEFKVDHQFTITGIGTTTFQLASGASWGSVPYPYLFNGRGTYYDGSSQSGFVVRNYFQTMGLYEFASSWYGYLFIYHNIGRLTGNKPKHFRPELALIHNMGVGDLGDVAAHSDIAINTLSKGYYESGLMVSNLLRFNYMNLMYFGLGGGVFARYGPYALPHLADNFSYKFAINVSF